MSMVRKEESAKRLSAGDPARERELLFAWAKDSDEMTKLAEKHPDHIVAIGCNDDMAMTSALVLHRGVRGRIQASFFNGYCERSATFDLFLSADDKAAMIAFLVHEDPQVQLLEPPPDNGLLGRLADLHAQAIEEAGINGPLTEPRR